MRMFDKRNDPPRLDVIPPPRGGGFTYERPAPVTRSPEYGCVVEKIKYREVKMGRGIPLFVLGMPEPVAFAEDRVDVNNPPHGGSGMMRAKKKKKRPAVSCVGCGAPVKKKTCEYCGRPYRDSAGSKNA